MSVTCKICWAWCPVKWGSVGWLDEEARCQIKLEHTGRDCTCEHASMTRPDNPNLKVNKPAPAVKKTRTRRSKIEPVLVRYDKSRPVMKPFKHQADAINRYRDMDEIPLFFEMGCGKSYTTLAIAEDKFRRGIIKGILVVAPNDVHRQWFDDLVNGVDVNGDGVMWQELGIDFEAQCVGGALGQKELYPFETEDLFKFVSVNVDTFSTPHKWEEIVAWANSNNYMLAIDEATVVKNPSSKRSQRLLYEFNDVMKRGRAIVASRKKHPVRVVLTGTPVTNGPMDLWAIMEFIRPNFFNRNYYSFRNYYGMFTSISVSTSYGSSREVDVLLTKKTWEGIKSCQDYREAHIMFGCSEDTYMTVKHQDKFVGPYKHADELKAQLDTVATFCKLTDCVDMPEQMYMTRSIRMSPEQQGAYDSMKKSMLAKYDAYECTAVNKLVMNVRLRQISSGFILGRQSIESDAYFEQMLNSDNMLTDYDIKPDQVVWLGNSIPKLDALMKDVDECDKPLIIVTCYSAEAAKIYELCKDKYSTCMITGWKTVGSIDGFKKGEYDIMVANAVKIHRGFNLQISHTVLFYSNSFSLEVRLQMERRTYRLGQKQPCLYVDYTCSNADDTVIEALRMKKGLLDYITSKDVKEVI